MTVLRSKSKGRGVYADRDYRKGAIIERAHVIVFPAQELNEDAVLAHYVFEWAGSHYAIALGTGSLYNHSYAPNLVYVPHADKNEMWYQAIQPIKAGDELTINYNGDPDDTSQVYFLDKKRAVVARGSK